MALALNILCIQNYQTIAVEIGNLFIKSHHHHHLLGNVKGAVTSENNRDFLICYLCLLSKWPLFNKYLMFKENHFRLLYELEVNHEMYASKWNESGFRPPLCTYRLNWARRTSWGWWDDWDDTVLQTQDSKFEPWRSEAEHATSRSRRLPTILTFTRGWGRNNFCFFQTAETGNRTPDSGVKGSGANHYPRAPALYASRRHLYQRIIIKRFLVWCNL